jgi:hypothetical protein
METLSQHLSELSAQAKKAEDRVARAQSETKDRLEEQRAEVHREAEAALDRVSEGLARASEGTKMHVTQLKSKVDADLERIREDASARKTKFEAWQASNFANDKAADAQAAIGYAVAAVKMAEVASLDAIEARGSAEIKAEQVQTV